ncbi:MAG: thymidine phosphorylase [Planctomycetes bacterium]|nr:thymidine phosphorylase [Planctomycetota bacterium]
MPSVPLDVASAVAAKRTGAAWSPRLVKALVDGYTCGDVDDAAMTEVLSAVFDRGLDDDELAAWTGAMLHSGSVLDWSWLDRPAVDKHSTGGVGDKISLCLAPAVAACGAAVPMVSGRALGHSGGTLDKLESIPGFRVDVSLDEARAIVERHGLVLMGQTAELAPADRRIYALRDATGLVASRPLIVSSIMSKKLAEGLAGLVLDVKVGSGAFMKTLADARDLGAALARVGAAQGCSTVARLTRMDRPLGRTVGNALEMREALEVLAGGGPSDVRALTLELGGEMLALVGLAESVADGARAVARVLDDGRARAVFRALVIAQDGDPRVVDDPSRLDVAEVRVPVLAPRDGFLAAIDGEAVGRAVHALGSGRSSPGAKVDLGVGLEVLRGVGERVSAGEPIFELRVRDRAAGQAEAARFVAAIEFADDPPEEVPLFLERLEVRAG